MPPSERPPSDGERTVEEVRYNPFTGRRLDDGDVGDGLDTTPAAARLGLEPPRFCERCGRRMVVQVSPDGWRATCSRHGAVDSTQSARR